MSGVSKRGRIDLPLLVLAVALAIASFLMFGAMITDKSSPYATEIAAALMGGLLTIVVTAVLLQKQTDVEMRKERNARMLDAKITTYDDLMEKLKDILAGGGEVGRAELVHVQILNQRLIYIAGQEVVTAFSSLAGAFAAAMKDGKLSDDEMNSLLEKAAEVSIAMRNDLLTQEERSAITDAGKQAFRNLALGNVKALAVPRITEEGFLDLCDADERVYFEQVVAHLKQYEVPYHMGSKGLSIADGAVFCFPTKSARNIELRKAKLSEEQIAAATTALTGLGLPPDRFSKASIAFRTVEVPSADFCDLLSRLF